MRASTARRKGQRRPDVNEVAALDMGSGIRFGHIPASAVHLCVDMQRLFAEDTPWRTPWAEQRRRYTA